MKKIIVLLLLMLTSTVVGQEDYALAGPVWTEVEGGEMEFAVHTGYAKELLWQIYAAVSAEFGSGAEAQVEIIKLFPVYKTLSLGVSAGGGVNYVDSEVPIEDLIFGSGGVVGTFGLSKTLGVWSFYEARTQTDPKVGFGLYLKL